MTHHNKRDFSWQGAKKAWLAGGAGILGMEIAALILKYIVGVNFFGVLPQYLMFLAIPLGQGLLSYIAAWLAKNRPKS